jgi:hypothetical protein
MQTMNKTQVLIPIDVANDLLRILFATAPRGQAHADELLRIYHSLSQAVAHTQRTR